MSMGPCERSTSPVEARLASPSASTLAVTRMPGSLDTDRPLEVELEWNGLYSLGSASTASVASWLSAHARVSVEIDGQPLSAPVTARPCGGGWILRALVRPTAWADAASVTVHSMSLAGRSVPCDCLPVTFNMRDDGKRMA